MNNAIEIKNVTKKFDGFTLNDISFVLPQGCILGLIGENGAGKSTTIKLIMNAIKKDSGEINVLGVNNESSDFDAVKEDIGVVLDEAYFPEIITAKVVDKMMKSTYRNWNSACFDDYMQRFRLPTDKKFKDYSRGMKMKLAIAVAMSHNPKLLILDEATSGLDPIVRDEILESFYDFTRDPKHSILLSSHIISDLEKLCDYVAFIHEGILNFCKGKDDLIDEYGIIHCSHRDFDNIPREAICGKKDVNYSLEVLVKRNLVSNELNVEKATLEDIILFMVKGEKK